MTIEFLRRVADALFFLINITYADKNRDNLQLF